MKPFNLQAALEGKPVVIRSGEEAVFLLHRTHPKHKQFPLVLSIGETQDIYSYRLDGMFHSTNIESCLDLFMAEEAAPDEKLEQLKLYTELYKSAHNEYQENYFFEKIQSLQ